MRSTKANKSPLEFVKHDRKRQNAHRIVDLRNHLEPYVTTSDLATYWRVSRRQIYKQIDAGTLKALRLGPRLIRIRTAEAARFEHMAKMSPILERRITQNVAITPGEARNRRATDRE